MKRLTILVLVTLVLGVAPTAMAGNWGIGGFGGLNIPVEQADAENGTVLGLKARWSPIKLFTIEPQVFLLKNSDWDLTYEPGKSQGNSPVTETFLGWEATSIGVNLVLGAAARPFKGLHPCVFGGVRLNSVDKDGHDKETKLGFGVGVGLEIGFGQFSFEVRGAGEVFPDGERSSRKNGIVTGGLNLYFGETKEKGDRQ